MWRIVSGKWLKERLCGRWWIKSSGCGCELNEERREMLRKEGIAEPSASIRSGASFVVSVHWQRTMQLQGCPSDSVLPQFVRSFASCLSYVEYFYCGSQLVIKYWTDRTNDVSVQECSPVIKNWQWVGIGSRTVEGVGTILSRELLWKKFIRRRVVVGEEY